jgi:hypothetical protein
MQIRKKAAFTQRGFIVYMPSINGKPLVDNKLIFMHPFALGHFLLFCSDADGGDVCDVSWADMFCKR